MPKSSREVKQELDTLVDQREQLDRQITLKRQEWANARAQEKLSDGDPVSEIKARNRKAAELPSPLRRGANA